MAETSETKTPARRKGPKFFMKQPQMLRVVYALVPILLSAIYFFGWRALSVVAVVIAAGLTTEWLMTRQRGKPVSLAVFVTCLLFGLSLPPTVPYYVAIVGIVVAVLFGKEVYGGFGRNFVNPAILGRAFVYVCFPTALTNRFVPAFEGFPGGFGQWSFLHAYRDTLPESLAAAGKTALDAVSQASPMYAMQDAHVQTSYWNMFWGNLSGTFQMDGQTEILTAGSMGEGCALLILAAAVFLLVTKTANWKLMLTGFAGVLFANVLFRNVMGFDGPGKENVPPVLFNLLGGTTLYALVFMVTDPVSAPKKSLAQYSYGFVIGFCMVFMRWRGVFVAAASFAILFGNIFGPLLDIGATAWEDRKKRKAAAARPSAGEAS